MLPYHRRIVDDELDDLLPALSAVAIEGAKGVGKTRTAVERARTIRRLDDPAEFDVARADPARLLEGAAPILIDEWQRLPEVWDLVRRRVDEGAAAGSFLLTGSAVPDPPPTHSGAGRIVTVQMRPMALSERFGGATVSLEELLSGDRAPIAGATGVRLDEYVEAIVSSGLPAIRELPGRPRRAQLQGYLDRLVDRDIRDEAGVSIRNPETLRRWLAAYAAASSSTASFETLRDAATAGETDKPSKRTTQVYRDALARLWVLDDVPAWLPTTNRLHELGQAAKHQLVDPAFAAQLLGLTPTALLASGRAMLGPLFESLATQSVRVYAQHHEAAVRHLRTARGRQEVDLIVARPDGRVVAIEVKLARTVDDGDVRHLRWLRQRLGDELLDEVVLTTGPEAYRRADGVAVVPLALLGP
ncbi:MAG: ATP-binding protein [Solirubrobacteraceae bacterium]|nr:ATP-binding protein [Solirubrobacteraceae bacterium]